MYTPVIKLFNHSESPKNLISALAYLAMFPKKSTQFIFVEHDLSIQIKFPRRIDVMIIRKYYEDITLSRYTKEKIVLDTYFRWPENKYYKIFTNYQ